MIRFEQPPEFTYFDKQRPAAGSLSFGLQLGPMLIRLSGLSQGLHDTLTERYGPYSAEAQASDYPTLSPEVRIQVKTSKNDYFIEPPTGFEFTRVHLAFDKERVRYLSYRAVGWFDVIQGSGELVLSSGDWEPDQRVLENFIRSVVAWKAAVHGGALVHAASAVHEGRGYLFFGESGAGKSTLSACNRRARIVSDDLSVILPIDGKPHLIGSPFRGTYEEGDPVLGAYPLQAGFRLIQAQEACVRSVPRAVAFSGLVGNLPFVAEAFAQRPELFESVQRAFADTPLAHLEFRKDDSYWDAIDKAGL